MESRKPDSKGHFIDNLSQAADQLGVSKTRLYQWRRNDLDWAKQLDLIDELIADELEVELRNCHIPAQITPLIFRLKALRPQKYRDNYHFEVENPKVQELLTEIKRLGNPDAPLALPAPKRNSQILDTTITVREPVEHKHEILIGGQ